MLEKEIIVQKFVFSKFFSLKDVEHYFYAGKTATNGRAAGGLLQALAENEAGAFQSYFAAIQNYFDLCVEFIFCDILRTYSLGQNAIFVFLTHIPNMDVYQMHN